MEIKIVEFDSDAYQDCLELRTEVLRKPLGLIYTKAFLEEEKEDIHLGAFEGDKVLGVLLLRPINQKEIKMRQVAVKPDIQKKGVGRELVKYSEALALEKGYEKMTLHARSTAVPFYQKLGYETEGNEFLEVGIPHYKMYKEL